MTDALPRQAANTDAPSKAPDFRLGQVTVRPGTGSADGPGGTVQLDPRVMQVLVCLASAGGEVVSRDSLMEQVWGDVIVTDFALSRCIYQLRKRLPQAARTEDSPIETLPKRGYRLVWPIEMIDSEPERPAYVPSRILAFGALAAVILLLTGLLLFNTQGRPGAGPGDGGSPSEGPIRIAVFPLDDLSEEGDQDQFARGLARELVHELARLPGLVVMGRTSAFSQAKENSTAFEHATRLGVDYALGGSVVPVGSARRVLLQLNRVPGGEQVWSRSFLLDHSTPLQVFREVAEFAAILSDFSINPSNRGGSTENLEAFELYLAGLETNNLETQRYLLQRAVEIDPEFANAWITLASIEVLPVWNGEQSIEDAWARVGPFLERALEIDPDSSWAFVELGRFKREFGELDDAVRYFRKALAIDPGNVWASANLGLVLRMTGQFEEALVLHERDVAMDPLDSKAQTRLGTSNWFMENFEEAERCYQRAVELNPMDEEVYDSWAGMLGAGLGRFDEALIMMERKRSVEDSPTPRTLTTMAELANTLGLEEEVEIFWQEILRIAPNHPAVPSQQAVRFLAREQFEPARAAAKKTLELWPTDTRAHLVLAILDLRGGHPEQFLARVNKAFDGVMSAPLHPRIPDVEEALLIALALKTNDRNDASTELLQRTRDTLQPPLAREHFWLAATHAMLGNPAEALAHLQASPPGRVRGRATMLKIDPHFSSLHDLPAFDKLVDEHLSELHRQRVAYLSTSLDHHSTLVR